MPIITKLVRNFSAAIVVLIAYVPASSALAAGGYSVAVGASHSDNIQRTPGEGGVEETVTSLTGAFIVSNESPRLSMSLFGQGTYLHYADNSFEDEIVPRGTLSIVWNVQPARMDWIVDDRFGQITADPFGAFTPDTIENTNIFSTGPQLTFGSSRQQLLLIGARAENHWYEDQDIDNNRLNGSIEFVRELDGSRNIGLTAYGEQVDFRNEAAGTDYNIYEAFLTYSHSSGALDFSIDAGVTSLEIDEEKSDGLLGRVNLSRSFQSNWIVRLSGEYSYTDSGSRFLIGREQSSAGPGQAVDDDSLVAAGSPLRLEHVDLGIGRRDDRQGFDLSVYWEAETYELDPEFDREQTGVALDYDIRFSPLNTAILRLNYRDVTFLSDDRGDENLEMEFRFMRSLTQNLSLTARIARIERTSTELASEFEENIYGLIVTYNSDLMDALQRQSRGSRWR
jgi:hypothetical protein